MGVNGIYGLSGSGIDIESMVKVGMLTKQKQYDKMQQSYTKNEWTKQAYNEIYNKLTTYSTSTLTPYKLASNMSAKTAVSANESAVTATANGNAVVMNHKVSVEQLSSSPYLVATQSLETRNGAKDSVTLADYIFSDWGFRDEFAYASNGDEALDDTSDAEIDLNATAFEIKVYDGTKMNTRVENEDGQMVTVEVDKPYTLKYTYGDLLGLSYRSNGKVKDNDNAKTFNDFVSDFNALGTNIKASYDAVGGKFSFYNKNGGETGQIRFEMSVSGVDEDDEEAVANAENAIKNTSSFFQGMKLAQSINGELKGIDADGNLVDFYQQDGAGIAGDNYYIGSGNAGSGTSAAITSAEALTYTVENEDGDEVEQVVDSTTSLARIFDDPTAFENDFSFSINGSGTFTFSYRAPEETEDDDAEEQLGTFVSSKYQTVESNNASIFADMLGADSISYIARTDSITYVKDVSHDFNLDEDDDISAIKNALRPQYQNSIEDIAFDTNTQLFSYEQTQSRESLAAELGIENLTFDSEENTYSYTRGGQTFEHISETDLNERLEELFNAAYGDTRDDFLSVSDGFSYTVYATIDDMMSMTNDNVQSISYDEVTNKLSYVSKDTVRQSSEDFITALREETGNDTIKFEDGKFSYVLETESVEIATVGDFLNMINAESDTSKVTASIVDGKFTFESTAKGSNSVINITTADEDSNVEDFFGTLFGEQDTDNDAEEEVEGVTSLLSARGVAAGTFGFGITGQYGSAIVDGVRFDNLTDNSVTAYGVTYKLHNTTVDESGAAQPVNVNIEQDVDSIVDRVKSFIEDYNKLLGSIYDKYDEKQYKDYTPLTASQKENMKDDQIEKWEEKAKSGLLYHDQTLSKIATKMREAISSPIDGLTGKYTSAFSLGISTTGIHGQLTLDEDKLRAALNDDSESVYKVFSTLSKDDTFSQNGISQRLSDVMVDATKLIKNRAGTDDSTNDDSDLGTLMRNLQNKMSDFKKLLDAFEDKLYKKYDAMEVALSTLGMQLSFITGGQ